MTNARMNLEELGLDSDEDMATPPASARQAQAAEESKSGGESQRPTVRRRASTSRAREGAPKLSESKRNRLRNTVNTVALSLKNIERRKEEKREELAEVAAEAREAGVSDLEIQGWIVSTGLGAEYVPEKNQ